MAIVRTANSKLNLDSYNCQELGLAKGLLALGWSIDIYSQFKGFDEHVIHSKIKGNRIALFPLVNSIGFREIAYYPGLLRKLKKGRYDIVQLHEDIQLMNAMVAFSFRNTLTRVVLFQGIYNAFRGWKGVFQRTLDIFIKPILTSDDIIKLSKTSSAKKYLESKGYRDISILPIGLDAPKRELSVENQSEIDNFVEGKDVVLLYVGVIEPRRNVHIVVETLINLIDNNSKAGLVLIGKGPSHDEIKKIIIEAKIEQHVLWKDSLPNSMLWMAYTKADFLLLPTSYEIYGMVLLEALYYGVLVISTEEAGPKEIIGTDLNLGKLLPLDASLWSEFILSIDKTHGKSKADYRKSIVTSKYDWYEISKNYASIVKPQRND